MILSYLKSLFQLILSPGRGWEDVRRAKADPRRLANGGLYPLIAIAAITVFVRFLWDSDVTFVSLLIESIVTFVMFFAAYFIGVFFMSIVMPELSAGAQIDKRVHTFVDYSIGLLTLMQIVTNLLPMDFTLLYFFPLYVAVIQWKGNEYMQVPDSHAGRFVLLAAPLVLLPPYLLLAFFKLLLP